MILFKTFLNCSMEKDQHFSDWVYHTKILNSYFKGYNTMMILNSESFSITKWTKTFETVWVIPSITSKSYILGLKPFRSPMTNLNWKASVNVRNSNPCGTSNSLVCTKSQIAQAPISPHQHCLPFPICYALPLCVCPNCQIREKNIFANMLGTSNVIVSKLVTSLVTAPIPSQILSPMCHPFLPPMLRAK